LGLGFGNLRDIDDPLWSAVVCVAEPVSACERVTTVAAAMLMRLHLICWSHILSHRGLHALLFVPPPLCARHRCD
jgi:hypothetical protein